MEEKKKSSKGLKVLVVILIVLLVGAAGYICYDKGLFDSFIKKNGSQEPAKVEKKLSEEEVMKLNDSTLTLSKHFGFYFERKVSIEEMPSNIMLEYAIANYLDENGIKFSTKELDKIGVCGIEEEDPYFCNIYDESDEPKKISNDITKKLTISKEDIDKYIKETFNTNRQFTSTESIRVVTENNYFYANYNSDNNEYYLFTPHKALESSDISSKVVKYEQKDDDIIIYNKPLVCFSGESGAGCNKYLILETYNDDAWNKTVIISKSGNNVTYDSDNKELPKEKEYIKFDEKQNKAVYDFDLIYKDFDSKLNTYKHIFKKADDGKYYWYSSEIVNE